MNETPDPSPRYRTVQLRVPVVSRGLVAAAVVAFLVLGGLAWGGYHLYQTNARTAQARAEMDGAARELAAREDSRLAAAEDGLNVLGQTVDKGVSADSSDAVNVNGYLDGQGRLRTAFGQVGPDIDGLYGQPHAALLTPARRQELDALRKRADAGTVQLAALDSRIQQAAQHKQKLAQAEAAAVKAAAARRAAAQQAASTPSSPPPPPSSPVYYDTAPYPYYYGYPYSYYRGPSIWFGGSWGHGGYHGGHGGGHHH